MTTPSQEAREALQIAPVQGYAPGIPWPMHLRAYSAYLKKCGPQPALLDLDGRNCRGGFHDSELDLLTPGWRDELALLDSTVAPLREELKSVRAQRDEYDRQVVLNRNNWRMDSEDKDRRYYALLAERDQLREQVKDATKNTAKDFELAFRLVREENDSLRAKVTALEAEGKEALVALESCIEHCYSDGQVHHKSFDTLKVGHAVLRLRSALDAAMQPKGEK